MFVDTNGRTGGRESVLCVGVRHRPTLTQKDNWNMVNNMHALSGEAAAYGPDGQKYEHPKDKRARSHKDRMLMREHQFNQIHIPFGNGITMTTSTTTKQGLCDVCE